MSRWQRPRWGETRWEPPHGLTLPPDDEADEDTEKRVSGEDAIRAVSGRRDGEQSAETNTD